jgi:hypothetical protein
MNKLPFLVTLLLPATAHADGMGRCYCDMAPNAPFSIGVVMAFTGAIALFLARRRRHA